MGSVKKFIYRNGSGYATDLDSRITKREIRKVKTNYSDFKKMKCVCGKAWNAIHHKKPVWVFETEMMLDWYTLQEKSGLDLGNDPPLLFRQIYIDLATSKENLIPLCDTCHQKAHDRTDGIWKRYFQKRGVCFNRFDSLIVVEARVKLANAGRNAAKAFYMSQGMTRVEANKMLNT